MADLTVETYATKSALLQELLNISQGRDDPGKLRDVVIRLGLTDTDDWTANSTYLIDPDTDEPAAP